MSDYGDTAVGIDGCDACPVHMWGGGGGGLFPKVTSSV